MIDVINTISATSFWLLLFVGVVSVFARVAFYRAHDYPKPRLLVRDASMLGGFSMSFGLVLAARFFRALGYDTSGLANNLIWTLATALPAVFAVAVFAYFEVFVIERGEPKQGEQ